MTVLRKLPQMKPSIFTRRDALGLVGTGMLASALTGCHARLTNQKPNGGNSAEATLDAIAWALLDLQPEGATSMGIDTGKHEDLRSRLGDRSADGQARIAAMLRKALKQVRATPRGGLPAQTATSLAVVESAFATALDGYDLPYGDVALGGWRNSPYVVIQNVGAYLDTPRFLDGDHPVHDAADAEAYLARLAAMPAQLDGELERLTAAGRIGVIAPAFLLDKAIRQLELSLIDARQGGNLVGSLVRRTGTIAGEWDRRGRAIAAGPVAAALDRQLTELKDQRLRASDDAGISARPRGDEWYAWSLRASTTTRHTSDDIHAIGRDQLAQLQARMDPILRKLGYTGGSVGERMAALGKDARFQFSNDDRGRADIIALMQAKIAFIRTRLPLAFRTMVQGNLEIRRLPLAEEPGAPAAYGGAGSIDGSVPGKIWLNLGSTDLHSRFSVPTLAFHEGIPGHVWQGGYANRLPLIRTMLAFNAYSEGWALYAETLGDELGAYDGDPVGQLGYLQSIAFRACRLVVDTGLHAKRWTREQAVDWFSASNGSSRTEVASEVDRYCSWPGQACGYKMGHNEVLAQRDRARRALADRYDLRDFNDAVVGGGNVPLDVLAQNVTRYITAAAPG